MKFCSPVFTATLACAGFAPLGLAQTTLTVGQSGSQFVTIQEAIDAAQNLPLVDTILVEDNAVYAEAIDFLGQDLVVECDPTDPATIEPPGPLTVPLIDMTGGLTRTAALRGFLVRNATSVALDLSGSSPRIEQNEFRDNSLLLGDLRSAGIYGVDASPLIQDNEFNSNTVFQNGGAIYLSGESTLPNPDLTQIRNNSFVSNTAVDFATTAFDRSGGAIYLDGDPTGAGDSQVFLLNNYFESNYARGFGGAIAAEARPVVVQNNFFVGNQMRFEIGDFYPCDSAIDYGGGAVSLVDCDYNLSLFEGNTYNANRSDFHGGAVYLQNSNARFTSELVQLGFASCQGGGIYAGPDSNSAIVACMIGVGNRAGQGGGVAYEGIGSGALIQSTIFQNAAGLDGAGVFGTGSSPLILDCLIDGNGSGLGLAGQPLSGGGLAFRGGTPQIERCEIIRNGAIVSGGGIDLTGVTTDTVVLGCILGANELCRDDTNPPGEGAAMYATFAGGGDVLFASNTVARNRAEDDGYAGIFIDSATNLNVVNSIIWNNKNFSSCNTTQTMTGSVNQTIFNAALGAAGSLVSFSDIVDSGAANSYTPGVGNIQAIPKFVNLGAQNFRLKQTSPCINVGTNSAALISSSDIDMENRIQGSIIDMGADERSVDQQPVQ